MFDLLLQTSVSAIAAGFFTTLFAVGLLLILGIMRICNFAQGELYMAGAYTVWFVSMQQELPYFMGVIAAALIGILLGLCMEFVLFRRVRHDMMGGMLLSIGAMFVLQTIAVYLFGVGLMKNVFSPVNGSWQILGVEGASISYQRIIVIGVSGGFLILYWIFLRHTRLGSALRACASDHEAAALQGININTMAVIAMALSAAMAGVAGAVMAPLVRVTPFMGNGAIITAFMIIIVGGTGSLVGAVIAAFLYTFLVTFVTTFADGETAQILALALMLLVLVIKPTGLGGGREKV